VYMH